MNISSVVSIGYKQHLDYCTSQCAFEYCLGDYNKLEQNCVAALDVGSNPNAKGLMTRGDLDK